MWITQPLHACSGRRSGSRVYCRQSGKRLSESHLCTTMAGAVPSITYMYSICIFFEWASQHFPIYDVIHTNMSRPFTYESWKGAFICWLFRTKTFPKLSKFGLAIFFHAELVGKKKRIEIVVTSSLKRSKTTFVFSSNAICWKVCKLAHFCTTRGQFFRDPYLP